MLIATTNAKAAANGLCPQDAWEISDALEDAYALADIMTACASEFVQISSGTVQRIGGMLKSTFAAMEAILQQGDEEADIE